MGLPANIIGIVNKLDLDALAFINAAGITNFTQKSAINSLVLGLKNNSLWTKCTAVYPMVGGTATTHKFNLKNPADTDAAFRLSFTGGWTHSSNGALPNGTNAYGNTFINTSTAFSSNSAHICYYSRTNSAVANEIVMGNLNGSNGTSGLNLVVRRTSDVNSFRATETATANGLINSTVTDSRGLFMGSITSATSRKTYKNGSLLATNSSNYTWNRANFNMFIGAALRTDTSVADFYTNKECAFVSIGSGLTDAEATTLYNIVQTYQTTLGRQV